MAAKKKIAVVFTVNETLFKLLWIEKRARDLWEEQFSVFSIEHCRKFAGKFVLIEREK